MVSGFFVCSNLSISPSDILRKFCKAHSMYHAGLLAVPKCSIVVFCISAFKVTNLIGVGEDVDS